MRLREPLSQPPIEFGGYVATVLEIYNHAISRLEVAGIFKFSDNPVFSAEGYIGALANLNALTGKPIGIGSVTSKLTAQDSLPLSLLREIVSIRSGLLNFYQGIVRRIGSPFRGFGAGLGRLGTNLGYVSVNSIDDASDSSKDDERPRESHHPLIDRKLLVSVSLLAGFSFSLFALDLVKSVVENRNSLFVVEYLFVFLSVIGAHSLLFPRWRTARSPFLLPILL